MKAKRTNPGRAALDAIRNTPDPGVLRPLAGLRKPTNDEHIFKRRAAAVQATYDNAPAGAEVIAAAVWRTLQSFRPKLSGAQMRNLYPPNMRLDVRVALYPKVVALEDQEIKAAEAADDARRLQRAAQAKRGRKADARG